MFIIKCTEGTMKKKKRKERQSPSQNRTTQLTRFNLLVYFLSGFSLGLKTAFLRYNVTTIKLNLLKCNVIF